MFESVDKSKAIKHGDFITDRCLIMRNTDTELTKRKSIFYIVDNCVLKVTLKFRNSVTICIIQIRTGKYQYSNHLYST